MMKVCQVNMSVCPLHPCSPRHITPLPAVYPSDHISKEKPAIVIASQQVVTTLTEPSSLIVTTC